MNILETYGGWIGLIVYFLYKDVWPVIRTKLIPNKVQEWEDERAFHRGLEKERLSETKRMTDAIVNLSLFMSQTNERVANVLINQQLILSRQDATLTVLTNAVADMRAMTGTRKGDV